MASLSKELIEEYNRTRGEDVDRSVLCHAPFTSMNFEQTGKASACCYNRTHVFGEYPRDSVEQMWFGAAAEQLRNDIRQDSLEGGCSMCQRQLESGNLAGCKARIDHQELRERRSREAESHVAIWPARAVAMPRVMEFELGRPATSSASCATGSFPRRFADTARSNRLSTGRTMPIS